MHYPLLPFSQPTTLHSTFNNNNNNNMVPITILSTHHITLYSQQQQQQQQGTHNRVVFITQSSLYATLAIWRERGDKHDAMVIVSHRSIRREGRKGGVVHGDWIGSPVALALMSGVHTKGTLSYDEPYIST